MRPARNRPPSPPSAPPRALAVILALLVFGLHLLASAPAAHAWLHQAAAHTDICAAADDHGAPASDDRGETTAHHDAGCAVSVFAQGCTTEPAAPDIAAPQIFSAPAIPPAITRHLAAAPARLHPPAHAPPSIA